MMNGIFFKKYNMEALRASGFWDDLLPPVGAAHQPGATNMEALRASRHRIHINVGANVGANVGTRNAVGVQGL